MKNQITLSELKNGQKFQIPSMALPSGYMRTYIYKHQVRVKTLVFESVDGSGALKLPEQMQFKIEVKLVD
jgi:hypothetical protein